MSLNWIKEHKFFVINKLELDDGAYVQVGQVGGKFLSYDQAEKYLTTLDKEYHYEIVPLV